MTREQTLFETLDCSIQMNELLIHYVQDTKARQELTRTVQKMHAIVAKVKNEAH